MPEIPDSQKKISRWYAGNLAYFRRPHYLRRIRFWGTVLSLVISVAVALSFGKWGSQKAFSTGPLSLNHAHLADRCDTCHTGSAAGNEGVFWENLPKFSATSALQAMDAACMKCHAGAGLHSPQMLNAGFRQSSQPDLVHASSCASCHKEHAGPGRMALPSDQACTDCHGSASKLQAARPAPKSRNASTPSPTAQGGETVDLGEGIALYIPPHASAEAKAAFTSFAHGHPGFGYEHPDARDPSDLKFNHARHFRTDIPKLNNSKLDCASCHQPDAGGVFMQPVRYEKHCQECHSLQIQPSLPNLRIPHGDAEKVKLFLAGLDISMEKSIRAGGVTEPLAVASMLKEEKEALQRRGLLSIRDLERRIFIEGDPQDPAEERLMRSGKPKFLTECAKCHTVKEGVGEAGLQVLLPKTPTRWLNKGAFNHAPHNQSACTECHGAALKSKLTSDILLPTQQSCTECHQPVTANGKEGVKFSCENCHHFHANFAPSPTEAALHSPKPSTPVPSQP